MLNAGPEPGIVNTTPVPSIGPSEAQATYPASKAALTVYTKMLREHLRLSGGRVKVFALLPTLVDTAPVSERTDRKMSAAELVNAMIAGLRNDDYTIRPCRQCP